MKATSATIEVGLRGGAIVPPEDIPFEGWHKPQPREVVERRRNRGIRLAHTPAKAKFRRARHPRRDERRLTAAPASVGDRPRPAQVAEPVSGSIRDERRKRRRHGSIEGRERLRDSQFNEPARRLGALGAEPLAHGGKHARHLRKRHAAYRQCALPRRNAHARTSRQHNIPDVRHANGAAACQCFGSTSRAARGAHPKKRTPHAARSQHTDRLVQLITRDRRFERKPVNAVEPRRRKIIALTARTNPRPATRHVDHRVRPCSICRPRRAIAMCGQLASLWKFSRHSVKVYRSLSS